LWKNKKKELRRNEVNWDVPERHPSFPKEKRKGCLARRRRKENFSVRRSRGFPCDGKKREATKQVYYWRAEQEKKKHPSCAAQEETQPLKKKKTNPPPVHNFKGKKPSSPGRSDPKKEFSIRYVPNN